MADEERPDNEAQADPAPDSESTGSRSPLPAIPESILEKVPEPDRQELREEISEFVESVTWGSPPHPLMSKVTEAHVGRMLDMQERGMELEAKDRNNGRWFLLAVAAIGVVVIIVLALADKDAILDDLLRLGIAFGGGFSGGYGIAQVRRH